jgi:hypothetical protein
MRTKIWCWKASLNFFAPAAENRNLTILHLNELASDPNRPK